ncbi:hypothetical protein Bca4012_101126 [Brassica carinata]
MLHLHIIGVGIHIWKFGANFCTFWKFWVHCNVNKRLGSNDANSEYSLGLNYTAENFGVDPRGSFCNLQSLGSI